MKVRRKVCDEHHLRLVRFFEEIKEAKLEERLALCQMLAGLKKSEADCVVVCDRCLAKKDNGAYDMTLQVRFCGHTTCLTRDIGRLCVNGEILNPEACVYR